MDKINVLVVPSDNMGGVGFYRSTQPHIQLEKQFPEDFSVTIDMNPDFGKIEEFKKYDIVHIHKALFQNMDLLYKTLDFFKKNGIVTIMDIDDHWKLGPHHPQYLTQKTYHFDRIIKQNFSLFDYVTTTTKIFANEIKPYNKNVVVLPNAIDPTDKRFQTIKEKSDFIRIGMIMGSSHEYDMQLLKGMTNKLPKEILDKIQFVLCGFDLRGTIKTIDPKTGKATSRNMLPKETVWYRYEDLLTDNWKIVSPQYKAYLDLFVKDEPFPGEKEEHYRRVWTKDINHYYEHYNLVDVLLAPLEITDFNKVKSQLKAIECCFSNTALIASDFGPYQLDLVSIFEKGGKINPNGNAILIDENKNHKDWAKAIKKLVENPELITMLQDNINKTLKDKFDLRKVTEQRAEFYRNAVNEKKKVQQ